MDAVSDTAKSPLSYLKTTITAIRNVLRSRNNDFEGEAIEKVMSTIIKRIPWWLKIAINMQYIYSVYVYFPILSPVISFGGNVIGTMTGGLYAVFPNFILNAIGYVGGTVFGIGSYFVGGVFKITTGFFPHHVACLYLLENVRNWLYHPMPDRQAVDIAVKLQKGFLPKQYANLANKTKPLLYEARKKLPPLIDDLKSSVMYTRTASNITERQLIARVTENIQKSKAFITDQEIFDMLEDFCINFFAKS